MGLREYRRKRDFTSTPEPAGGVSHDEPGPHRTFVVQKHAASRLHYDFRLELDGVLKSWAVPKGPSLDPADKRLAMHVEDHPIEYGDFEGVIPKGQYGGGTARLWDRGTWEPVGDAHQAYRAGALKFTLKSEKLRGGWTLVRIGAGRKGPGDDRSWLLNKRDQHAVAGAPIVGRQPKSVASGRSLEENRGRDAVESAAVEVSGARSAALPKLVRLDRRRVELSSRTGRDWTDRFPAVAAAIGRLPAKQAMLDGEITVIQADGTTSREALQNLLSGREAVGSRT